MVIHDIEVGGVQEEYRLVRIMTSRGTVQARYFPALGTHRAAMWVGGIGGDWDTPAHGLYPRLCRELIHDGIASLRVRFRHPTMLEEAVLDVLAGLSYLRSEGIDSVALVGHSFGGAVVIQAAAASPAARAVVTLASQSYGAEPVARLGPRVATLLIHGTADQVLPSRASVHLHRLAQEPKRLLLYEGANHGLDEVADDVRQAVHDWIVEWLPEERT